MRVSVVGGTAGFGRALAFRLAKLGETVVVGSRQMEKAVAAADEISRELGAEARISGADNPSSVAGADVVVVAVPFAGQAEIYRSIKDSLAEGAIVIDTTVPLAAEVGGKATRMLGVWEGSAAQQAKGVLSGKKVHLASGFHTITTDRLLHDEPLDMDVLVCGDAQAKEVAEKIVGMLPGARFVDCGALENARIIESITALVIGLNVRYKLHPGAGIRITGL